MMNTYACDKTHTHAEPRMEWNGMTCVLADETDPWRDENRDRVSERDEDKKPESVY